VGEIKKGEEMVQTWPATAGFEGFDNIEVGFLAIVGRPDVQPKWVEVVAT
jgi:hypothetical protein